MAAGKFILKDVSITVNGVDLSTRCRQLTVSDSKAVVDATTFQGGGYVEEMPGLGTASITAEFTQDFASGSVHQTLSGLYASGASFDVVFKGTSVATGLLNPQGTLVARLFSYVPFSGNVGDLAMTTAEFRNAGTGIAYATS